MYLDFDEVRIAVVIEEVPIAWVQAAAGPICEILTLEEVDEAQLVIPSAFAGPTVLPLKQQDGDLAALRHAPQELEDVLVAPSWAVTRQLPRNQESLQ